MSYHPDQEFCLVSFEEQVSNPEIKGNGFWGTWGLSEEEKESYTQYKTIDKRNGIRNEEALNAINAAKRDKYKPVFALFQKGEVFIFGMKGRSSRWEGVPAEKIVTGTYTDRIRSIVSIRINKKGRFKDIDNWREVIKIAEQPKDDSKGGASNSQRSRGGGGSNKGGTTANQEAAKNSRN